MICWRMTVNGDLGNLHYKKEEHYNYDKDNYELMKNKFLSIDWEQLVKNANTEECWGLISRHLTSIRNDCIPKRKRSNRRNSSFMNHTALKMIKKEIKAGRLTVKIQPGPVRIITR